MKVLFLSAALILSACSSKSDIPELPKSLKKAVQSNPFRSPENLKRDNFRHPLETLNFFGLESNMTVLEVSPGRGWYMEILAPYLTPKGKYIMATPVPDKPYFKAMEESINAWKEKFPMVKTEKVTFSPPHKIQFPEKGSVDMVLTFRNVHNWLSQSGEKAAFKAFYDVLKPGGILGVVEHRAHPSQEDRFSKNGYMRETDVIELAAQAGFILIGTSEINANSKDTKDYPHGVWSLPPTLRGGEIDKEKYLDIGESDRMTIKFMKPNK